MADVKLGIGLPLSDEKVHSQFVDTWTLMEKPDFVYIRPSFPSGPTSNIADIRNNMVEQALQNDVTKFLQLDTDQTYPRDVIHRLLTHDLPIVAAKVHRRYPPFDPILYRGESVDKLINIPDEEWKGDRGIIEVSATGSGCILVDMNVYLDIEYPWYEHNVKKDGMTVGEDVGFCFKAREAGYKVYVDTSIQIGHLALLEVNEGAYDIFKMLNSPREAKNGSKGRKRL